MNIETILLAVLTVALVVAVIVAANFAQLHAEAESDLADVLRMLGVAEWEPSKS